MAKLGDPHTNLRILLQLKQHYGTLNCALVGEYHRANGKINPHRTAQDVGLNRSVVIRCIQALSENDSPK